MASVSPKKFGTKPVPTESKLQAPVGASRAKAIKAAAEHTGEKTTPTAKKRKSTTRSTDYHYLPRFQAAIRRIAKMHGDNLAMRFSPKIISVFTASVSRLLENILQNVSDRLTTIGGRRNLTADHVILCLAPSLTMAGHPRALELLPECRRRARLAVSMYANSKTPKK